MDIASLKEAGADAFSSGNYSEAVSKWSDALGKTAGASEHKEMERALLCNRSYAFLYSGNLRAALLDAEKCNKVDPSWAKGHIRRGEVLYRMARFGDAVAAYDQAFSLDASLRNKETYKVSYEKNVRLAGRGTGARAGPSGGTAPTSTRGSGSGGSLLMRGVGLVQSLLRVYILFNFVCMVLPSLVLLSAHQQYAFFRLGMTGVAYFLIALLARHGRPSFTQAYAQKIIADTSFMYLFMSGILSGTALSRTYLLAAQPIVLVTGAMLARDAAGMLPLVTSIGSRLIDMVTARFGATAGWATLSSETKWAKFMSVTIAAAAKAEVYHGLYLIYELITPKRNLVMLLLWWQFLQLRYMMDRDGHIKAVFASIDQGVLGVTQASWCPQVAGAGYMWLRNYLFNRSDFEAVAREQRRQQEVGSQGGSILDQMKARCSVM